MKTITVKVDFPEGGTHSLVLKVYSHADPDISYSHTHHESFEKSFDQLKAGTMYQIDFTGHTSTGFDVKISGQFNDPNPIKETIAEGGLTRSYTIKTGNHEE